MDREPFSRNMGRRRESLVSMNASQLWSFSVYFSKRLLYARGCEREGQRRSSPASGTGIQQGVDTQNTKLCQRLCAKSPLKGKENMLVFEGYLNFRTQRILERTGFPQIPVLSCTGVSRVLLQSHSPAKISLRMSLRAPSHPPPLHCKKLPVTPGFL